MVPDAGVLSEILKNFETAFQGGQIVVRGYAVSLLGVLVALELAFLGLWGALAGQEIVTPFLKKVLAIGFFSWVVLNFDTLSQEVLSGFTSVGKAAAGASGGDTTPVLDPSSIVQQGFDLTLGLFTYVKNTQDESFLGIGFAIDSIVACAGAIVILASFYLIALQVFVTRLEFSLLIALSIILIPFGIFKHTAFLAEKTFGAIISFGIKLMVLTFILSIAMPVLSRYTIPVNPNWDNIFNMLFASLTIAYLSWHAPAITAGMLSGSPALSGIGAAGKVAAAAGGAVAGAALAAAGALAGGPAAIAAWAASTVAGASSGGSDVKAATVGANQSDTSGVATPPGTGKGEGQSGASTGASQNSGNEGLTQARSVKGGDGSSPGSSSGSGESTSTNGSSPSTSGSGNSGSNRTDSDSVKGTAAAAKQAEAQKQSGDNSQQGSNSSASSSISNQAGSSSRTNSAATSAAARAAKDPATTRQGSEAKPVKT